MSYNILCYNSRVLICPIQVFVILGVGCYFTIFNNILKYFPKLDFLLSVRQNQILFIHTGAFKLNVAIINTNRNILQEKQSPMKTNRMQNKDTELY